jgi:hypothetical protein
VVLPGNPRISPDFFRTLGVPLVAGADFGREPGANAGHAIVTQQLASTLWPGESAIGKVVWAGPTDRLTELEVTGVVADAYFGGRVTDAPPRFIFAATDARPDPPGETTLFIRHRGSTDLIAPAVSRALREADGRVPIAALRSLDSQLASEHGRRPILRRKRTMQLDAFEPEIVAPHLSGSSASIEAQTARHLDLRRFRRETDARIRPVERAGQTLGSNKGSNQRNIRADAALDAGNRLSLQRSTELIFFAGPRRGRLPPADIIPVCGFERRTARSVCRTRVRPHEAGVLRHEPPWRPGFRHAGCARLE